jgi:DoxX-like family
MNRLTEPEVKVSKGVLLASWVLSGLIIMLFLMSAFFKLSNSPAIVEGFTKFGYDPKLAMNIGIVELACTILYAVPRTAAVGAILLTGYLGGALGTHLRIGDPWYAPVVIGVLLWVALVMRYPKLRAVLPW